MGQELGFGTVLSPPAQHRHPVPSRPDLRPRPSLHLQPDGQPDLLPT